MQPVFLQMLQQGSASAMYKPLGRPRRSGRKQHKQWMIEGKMLVVKTARGARQRVRSVDFQSGREEFVRQAFLAVQNQYGLQ